MSPQMRDRARMEIAEYRARQSSPMFRTESNKIASWLREHDKNNVYLKNRERFQKVVRWGMDFTQRIDTNMANAMWLAIYNYNFDRLQDVRTKNNMCYLRVLDGFIEMDMC